MLNRRVAAACIVATMLVSLSAALALQWQRPSMRLASALVWLAGLAVLWIGVSIGERHTLTGIVRPPVGPPLSAAAEGMALAAVLIVAVAMRFVLLAGVPPFIVNDESMFAFEATWRPEYPELYGASLLQSWPAGWGPQLFGIGWNGFPTLSFFVHWLPMTVLGISNWSLRCGCAIVGTASILVVYRWVRRWWGNVVALAAALALAVNSEHVYWSRIALNNIDAALLGACALAALAWALDTRSRRAWVAVGYALGFGFYTFHGANLHPPLAALVLLILLVGRRERFSWADGCGFALAALATALVVAPLVPALMLRWADWHGYQAGRFDISMFFGALGRHDMLSARLYVYSHFRETSRLFQPVPVMCALALFGSAIALWHWKDPRYLTAMLWTGGILVVGSVTIGWRSARLIGAMPAASVMPALAFGHVRAMLLRWAPAAVRRAATACGLVLLAVVLYEGWWVEFVWRAQFRNTTFGLCRAIQRLPLPATVYVIGRGDGLAPDEALHVCATPDDPRRHVITMPPRTDALPEIGNDPNVLVIVFPNREDLLPAIRQRYPHTVAEPYLLNGPDPFAGLVPGAAIGPPGAVAFYVVKLRSTCPVTSLLQTYDPCWLAPSS